MEFFSDFFQRSDAGLIGLGLPIREVGGLFPNGHFRIDSFNFYLSLHSQFHYTASSHARLTPAFSGATSGNERNHSNRAAWPPLQRLVRRVSAGMAVFLPPLITIFSFLDLESDCV